MSQNLYNPISYPQIQPDVPGFVDAIDHSRQTRMAQMADKFGLEAMHMGNQKAAVDLEHHKATRPHELSVSATKGRRADLERNTPGHLEDMLAGERAEAGKKRIDLKISEGTHQGAINNTNSANALSQLTNDLMRVQALGAKHPLLGQAEYQKVVGSIGDPTLKTAMPGMYDPKSIEETIEALSKTPTHRGNMAEARERTRSAEAIARGNNATAIEVARMRAGARIKSLLEQFESAKTPEQMLMYGQMILMDPEVEESTRTMVVKGVETASRIIAEKQARGAFNFADPRAGAGPIAGQIHQRLGGAQPGQPGPMGPNQGQGITPPPGSNILRFDNKGNPIR